jgi:hypothetical protein
VTALDDVRKRAVDLGFAIGWRLVRAMPESAAHGLFRSAADVGTAPRTSGGPGNCAEICGGWSAR